MADAPKCEAETVNKIGIHGLVWAGSWGAEECRYAIASTREAGFDIIELPVFQPRSLDIDVITRSVAEHGLGVTCSLGLSFDNDINSSDPAVGGTRRAVAQRRALRHP